ncbi:MAG: DUF58 domain-containing protein [Cyclobacteriaceae bacterium]|nr:DUF58 domain-containing protein [Cyclobacteriaceae bacterium]
MRDIVKKLRKYQIQIRKAINNQMQGDFHSVFKGSGLEFDDVRAYQYGDDSRTIDWNVTAKGHGTFVRTYKEEKEQIVFFLIDVSASQEIGNPGNQKIDIAREICGVLSLSAVQEQSQVGLICFSDIKEKYVKPGKGESHAFRFIADLMDLKPKSLRTDISKSILFALNLIKRKSVVIMISDFIDEGYEHNLRALASQHDLVVVHISDMRETQLPRLGIVPLLDKESKKTIWTNTSSSAFRGDLKEMFEGNQGKLEHFCRKYQANYINIFTDEDYVPKLIKLFRVRNKSRKIA